MTLKTAAEACGGKLLGCPNPALGIGRAVIDSRAVESGDLFVAFRGEKTDGHRYIQMALDKGAVCALAEYVPDGVEGPVIVVENVQTALEKIAAAYRETLRRQDDGQGDDRERPVRPLQRPQDGRQP